MPDLDNLYPGRFLKGRTIEAPKLIKILKVGGDLLENDDNRKQFKAIITYTDESKKEGEIVWNRTNGELTAAMYGRDYDAWPGKYVAIHFDPTVKMMGELKGGIRVWGAPASVLPARKRVEILRPRRKKPDVYFLNPWRPGSKAESAPPAALDPTNGTNEDTT